MWSEEWDKDPADERSNPWHDDDEFLPRICLVQVPHSTIPGMFQCCFEYIEPWRYDPVAETVETGKWAHVSDRDPFASDDEIGGGNSIGSGPAGEAP